MLDNFVFQSRNSQDCDEIALLAAGDETIGFYIPTLFSRERSMGK